MVQLLNRVAAYKDSIYHHYKMVKMAIYKDSIANLLIKESNGIKRKLNAECSAVTENMGSHNRHIVMRTEAIKTPL